MHIYGLFPLLHLKDIFQSQPRKSERRVSYSLLCCKRHTFTLLLVLVLVFIHLRHRTSALSDNCRISVSHMGISLLARSYSYTRNGTGAIILTKVVLGKIRNVAGWNEVMACPPGFDSVSIHRAFIQSYPKSFSLLGRL